MVPPVVGNPLALRNQSFLNIISFPEYPPSLSTAHGTRKLPRRKAWLLVSSMAWCAELIL
jgi:hypothetical protein